ncbi:UNVERIFIED_CONTAM: Salicylic acid-binding protein 2 [Sesamum latifolium]|uniref:Salicylic acid-binding protein 2 n=1 Tax=Sesamum latifolium TaxID=2727402 RepID=A0AAW2XAS2_9LAMI
MPDITNKPSYVVEQAEISPEEWLDTEFKPFGSPEENLTSVSFGPHFISTKLYPQSPAEDVVLANTLVRPGSLFLPDLSNRSPFSKEGYGSVKRVFILCLKDKVIPIKFQHWQIENFAPDQVKEIDNSDHMVMISKPQDVSQRLLEIIADYYD